MPTSFATPQDELAYIKQKAASLGLDPEAVLAVAVHEGVTLPAEVGDSGTSFGPWQEHEGGALPSSIGARGPAYASAWANSQQGIDDALTKIASVASGQTGPAAIHSIVYGFEHPKDPASEYAASVSTYRSNQMPTLGGSKSGLYDPHTGQPLNPPSAGSGGISGATPGVGGIIGGIHSTEKAIEFLTSWRFAEIVGGFLLLLVGLYLLGRQFGLAVPTPTPLDSERLRQFQFSSGEEYQAMNRRAARPPRTQVWREPKPGKPVGSFKQLDRPKRVASGRPSGYSDEIPY